MKRRRLILLVVLSALLGSLQLPAQDEAPPERSAPGITYVVPVKGPIDRALLFVMRRGLEQAVSEDAGAIVLRMDTPGGELDSIKEIVTLLQNVDVPKYTFVEGEAISGGAIISLATDEIYMMPGARIGDAMPIMVSMFGGVEDLPGDVQEKMNSYVASYVRSVAQQQGHDDELAEAMVRPESVYTSDVGEVICEEGKLLTMTNIEAERVITKNGVKRPLLSSGTVKDFDGFLAAIGREDTEVVVLEVTWSEYLARVITHFAVRSILLMIGLIGIYVEIKTPGFGWPGTLGILCLVVFFWGYAVAGLAGMEEILVFGIGVVLLLVEVFLIPGFGIVGITGIICMVAGLLMAMVENYPGQPWYDIPTPDIGGALGSFSLAVVGTTVGAIMLVRFLPATGALKPLTLATRASAEEGYVASRDADTMVGMEGIAVTPLNPSGTGMFGERRLPVQARGEFLESGTSIVVAEVRGNRILVNKV